MLAVAINEPPRFGGEFDALIGSVGAKADVGGEQKKARSEIAFSKLASESQQRLQMTGIPVNFEAGPFCASCAERLPIAALALGTHDLQALVVCKDGLGIALADGMKHQP